MNAQDTIVASATAPGRGAISVIRLSGPNSVHIASLCCNKTLRPRYATFGSFLNASAQLDSGLWFFYPGPHSFTGEDIVEFQGHGGPVVIQSIIEALVHAGARLARPGEFTERAFLNNKIDLTQAEAISDLITASSIEAVKAANRSLAGGFGQEIQSIVEQITHLRTHLEAHIDFPDEDISPQALSEFGTVMTAALAYLETLLANASQGEKLNQASDIVLIGAPNAGKSSLLNALAKQPLAIVTDIPGTTRDLIRHTIVTQGLELRITDTAGIRETENQIEQEGIQRARNALAGADLIVCLFDEHTQDIGMNQILELLDTDNVSEPVVLIRNKIDLYDASAFTNNTPYPLVEISAKTGVGLDTLLNQMRSALEILPREDVYLARSRHVQLLTAARGYLFAATEQPLSHSCIDLIADDLRLAQNCLSEITGRFTSDDLLGEIFSNFCIGK